MNSVAMFIELALLHELGKPKVEGPFYRCRRFVELAPGECRINIQNKILEKTWEEDRKIREFSGRPVRGGGRGGDIVNTRKINLNVKTK